MSFATFVPEVVSAFVETAYTAGQVVIPTLNSAHEGEAKTGNAVKIVGSSNPTITDYAANGRKHDTKSLSPAAVTVLIDQERSYSFLVDDIDAAQVAGSLEPYTVEHGESLAEDAEKYVIAKLVAEGTSINIVGSAPVKVDTPAKAKAVAASIRTALTKAKVPVADRFLAANPVYIGLLLDALGDNPNAGDVELRNGQVARIYGLTVLETACFAEETKPVAIGYHGKAAAFISQLTATEALRSTESSADIVRGLNVFGSKVTRPAGVVVFVSEGTAAPVAP